MVLSVTNLSSSLAPPSFPSTVPAKKDSVWEFSQKYFQAKQEFEASQKALGLLKSWIWTHHDDSGLMGLVAKFFAWMSQSVQRDIKRMDGLQLHTACYQHFAHIHQTGLGVPGAPQSKDFDDPFICLKKEWRQAAEKLVLGMISLNDLPDFKNDRELVQLAVEQDGLALQYASDDLRADPEIIEAAFNQNHRAALHAILSPGLPAKYQAWKTAFDLVSSEGLKLGTLSAKFRSDKEIVLAAVSQYGSALHFASKPLKDDKEVVLAAVSQDSWALQFASNALQDDPEIIAAATKQNPATAKCAIPTAPDTSKKSKEWQMAFALVSSNGYKLQTLSDEFKNDKEIVLAAVSQCGAALFYASTTLQSDKDVVLAAVSQNNFVLQYVSDALQADPEIIAAAFNQNPATAKCAIPTAPDTSKTAPDTSKKSKEWQDVFALVSADGYQLGYLSAEFKNDKEIVLAAVSQNGTALCYASTTLKNDKDVVLAAVSQNGTALFYASTTLQSDKDFVLAAVSQNSFALQYASDALRADPEVIAAAIKQNPTAAKFAIATPDTSKKSKEWQEAFARVSLNGYELYALSDEFKNDKEIVLAAVSQAGLAISYASAALKNDKDVVLAAVSQNGMALCNANTALKNDKDVVLAAVLQCSMARSYASDALRADPEIIAAAIQQNSAAATFAIAAPNTLKKPKEWQDAFTLVSSNGYKLQTLSDEFKNDKEIVLAAVSQCGGALQFASTALKNNKEIVLAAVSQCGVAIEYASHALQDDPEIIIAAIQ